MNIPDSEETDVYMKIDIQKELIRGLEASNLNLIRTIPKSDLHSHGVLGGSISLLEERLGRKIPRPPERMNGIEGMDEYLGKDLRAIYSSKEGFELLTELAFLQAKHDGITRLEMSTDSRFIGYYESNLEDFIDSIKNIRRLTAPEVVFAPELSISWKKDTHQLGPWAEECIESGYFKSIDFCGVESVEIMQSTEFPKELTYLYSKAKRNGMKLKAHVGEFGDAESVRRAVETLELDEVHHGISAASSQEVMRFLERNDIQLNVCPTSNVRLNTVVSLKVHPIRTLFDHGIRVTINSDDILVFNQSVSEEYLSLYRAGLFTPEELDIIRQYGLDDRYG